MRSRATAVREEGGGPPLCAATARPYVAPHAPQPHTRCPRACTATRRRRARSAALGAWGVRNSQCQQRDARGDQVRNTASGTATTRAPTLTESTPRATLSPWRLSGGCRARAGARAQRPVRATARRPLAAPWRPRLRNGAEERGLRLSSHLPQDRTKGVQAGSPRTLPRVPVYDARVRSPSPRPPTLPCGLPLHAHTTVSTSSPPWRFLERGTTRPRDGGSEPAPLRVSSPGGSERRTTRGLTRPRARRARNVGAFARGGIEEELAAGVEPRARPPRETRRTAVLLVPSAERSPRAGRG